MRLAAKAIVQAEPLARALVETADLSKSYGDKLVLDKLSLAIERGETLAIIGGSGSGKSTFARLLMGLERPTSGHIYVGGEDTTLLSDHELMRVRHRFAMVFQRHALLDSMSVFDNVAFPLREHDHLREEEVHVRVEGALDELGVLGAAAKLPGELSGGMAKRVGIARALVTEPEILVYDEPTSGLDPVSSRTVDGLIEQMRVEHLVTSIVITHDMVTAYDVADQVALLGRGTIIARGDPETIFTVENGEVLPFAISSGLDLKRLGPRKARKPPEEIRERWAIEHAVLPEPPRKGLFRWVRNSLLQHG
jgi:phospholipid/cholesterol/gamma-HCH transport system ATP-binding protein